VTSVGAASVHNSAEDLVVTLVDEIFDDESAAPPAAGGPLCRCDQCRVDVVCYVLNRAEPAYIVSGRGLAHHQLDFETRLQREADLLTLVHRGIGQVMSARRHGAVIRTPGEGAASAAGKAGGVALPPVSGRLLTSADLRPAIDVEVALRLDGAVLAMVNENWQNPCRTAAQTPGAFIFWPAAIELTKQAASRPETADVVSVELEVTVDDARFQPFRHHFSVPSSLDRRGGRALDLERVSKLGDLYLAPLGEE
jgi:competence protein ComFB